MLERRRGEEEREREREMMVALQRLVCNGFENLERSDRFRLEKPGVARNKGGRAKPL
jgi:hypothetical protein